MLTKIRKKLRESRKPGKKAVLQRFFKTGPGEYAEGDIFLGVMVPEIRKTAKDFKDLSISNLIKLLRSPIHEERLLALIIMVQQYKEGATNKKKIIYEQYIGNTRYINNWDLIDLTAEHIVGAYLSDKNKDLLVRFAKSKSLWERRIAIISTYNYIKQGSFNITLRIAYMLLHDKEDLIHKAVGWMLREVGKRSLKTEEQFLKKHYHIMPRTMLRYAIEKFPEKKRKSYLNK